MYPFPTYNHPFHNLAKKSSTNGNFSNLPNNKPYNYDLSKSAKTYQKIFWVWPEKRLIFFSPKPRSIVCLLKAYSPANRTGSPQGFSQIQILHMSHQKAFNINKK